jgi:hypothetical protein
VVASRGAVTASALAALVDVVAGVSRLVVVNNALMDKGCLIPLQCGLRMNRGLFLVSRGLRRLLGGKSTAPRVCRAFLWPCHLCLYRHKLHHYVYVFTGASVSPPLCPVPVFVARRYGYYNDQIYFGLTAAMYRPMHASLSTSFMAYVLVNWM